jgi:chemotaxis protein MotA
MKRPDFAIPLGVAVGLAAIGGGALLEGVRLGFLWQPTAALVVLGGTLGAVIVRRGVGGLCGALRATLALGTRENNDELEAAVARLAWLARAVRREGVQILESHADSSPDPLLTQGLKLAADYAEPAAVRTALGRQLEQEYARGMRDVGTLDAAGGYAPTFGILGAVLGLIQVLRVLADPQLLGIGIATAFVATIYGVGLANLVLFPLAARLRERLDQRIHQREMLVEAIVGLAARETPGAITRRVAANAWLDAQTVLLKLPQLAP